MAVNRWIQQRSTLSRIYSIRCDFPYKHSGRYDVKTRIAKEKSRSNSQTVIQQEMRESLNTKNISVIHDECMRKWMWKCSTTANNLLIAIADELSTFPKAKFPDSFVPKHQESKLEGDRSSYTNCAVCKQEFMLGHLWLFIMCSNPVTCSYRNVRNDYLTWNSMALLN